MPKAISLRTHLAQVPSLHPAAVLRLLWIIGLVLAAFGLMTFWYARDGVG
jgi:hypothetical protein